MNAETSKCSVVIPLYNHSDTIQRCVDSVLGQGFEDFELIVVDDGSTDGGGDLVSGMQDSRVHLVMQENGGVSSARNRGIAEARGTIVAFLDADDEWNPDYLETIFRSEEHTSELQSRRNLVCRLLLEKKKEEDKSAFQ